jgi:hypothetical protein
VIQVTFRPLPVWPHPVTDPRSYPRFKSSYAQTLSLLEREINMLEGRNIIIGIGLAEHEIRQDGMPRSNAKAPAHPGVELSFDSKFGRLTYATDQFESGGWGRTDDWKHNLRAIALSLESLRAVDRYGVSTRGQQYAGWKALPGAVAIGPVMDEREAYRTLRVVTGATFDDIPQGDAKGLYRAAAAKVHPDVGGSREDWDRVQAAGRALGVAS